MVSGNRALSACLCIALLLVIGFVGLASSSTGAQTLASGIIIEDADGVWTNILITSADLIDVAENVTPRVVAEYANSIFRVALCSCNDLNRAASVVSPRIIVEYADSLFETGLYEIGPAPPVLSVSPTSLDFGAIQTQKTFNISNAGGGTLTWSVSEDKTWLSVSPTSGTGHATLTVNVDRSGLNPGDYTAEIIVSSNGGNKTVHVTMEVEEIPSVDLQVEHIVPVQVIEGVPLVKDKATMVRCFVKLEEVEDLQVVEAQAEVDFGGNTRTVNGWLVNFEGKTYAFPTIEEASGFSSRAEEDAVLETTHWFKSQIQFHGIDSINFDFPREPLIPAIAADLEIHVEVIPVGLIDSDISNNVLTLIATVKPMKKDLKMWFERARVWPGGGSFQTTPNDSFNLAQTHLGFLIATYPIAEKQIDARGCFQDGLPYPQVGKNWFMINRSIDMWAAGYWKGVYIVPDEWLSPNYGKSHPLAPRAVLVNEISPADTTAHEIGHTYGFVHPEEEHPPEDIPLAANGWDVNHYTISNHIPGPAKVSVEPSWLSKYNFYDFMSATFESMRPPWINEDHYKELMDQLVSGGADPRLLFVSGLIYEDGRVELSPFYSSSGIPDSVPSGSYSFETVAADDSVLGSTTFEAVFDATGCCPFAFAMPYPDGTEKVVLKHEDLILEEVTATEHDPQVTIEPVVDLGNEKYRVEWQATDPDGDELDFLVYYSHSGEEWCPLSAEDTLVELDSALLPGGDAVSIKVIATDGMNTVEEISAPFSVPTKAPTASIVSPVDGSSFPEGSRILFKGFGYDPEDGQLNSSSLLWTSDVDGVLEEGNILYFSNLSLGNHRIGLTATDSEGKTATVSIQIRIYTPGHKVYLPLIMKNYP